MSARYIPVHQNQEPLDESPFLAVYLSGSSLRRTVWIGSAGFCACSGRFFLLSAGSELEHKYNNEDQEVAKEKGHDGNGHFHRGGHLR